MDKKNDILKKGLLSTESDFTSKLMQELDAEEQALSNILTKHSVSKTSPDFTSQLMTQLEGKHPKAPYTPVISKQAWIGIAAAFIGIVLVVLFSASPDAEGSKYGQYLHGTADHVRSVFSQVPRHYYLLTGGFVLSLALLAEQRYSKR